MPGGGGLLQLVAQGKQDVFLTGNPQITWFKMVYRRYTNFAMESQQIYFDGDPDFGKRVTALVPRRGDLLGPIIMEVVLPYITMSDGTSGAYVNSTGYSLIEEINWYYNMITSTSNLLQLHTLKALHLASNNLARIVAISKMSSLTVLNLNHNPINYFPASFGNSNNSLKVLSIDSWTRSGLPPCYMPNAEIWLFTPPSSDEVFERPL